MNADRWDVYRFSTNEMRIGKPDESEFFRELAAGVPITPEELFPWLTLKQPERFTLADLPELRKRALAAKVDLNKRMTDPARKPPQPAAAVQDRAHWDWLLIGGGVFGLALAAFARARRVF